MEFVRFTAAVIVTFWFLIFPVLFMGWELGSGSKIKTFWIIIQLFIWFFILYYLTISYLISFLSSPMW